ncbi:MAG: M28 family peptidase, partial [Planctomycetes bacterium]|nr:M28 family peptidase [Planctomycetota bacterium]
DYVAITLSIYYAGALLLVGQWSIGKFVPGGCDNASGVAAALVLASRWRQQIPSDVELVVLLPGSEEVGSLGAAAWLDANQASLSATPTRFLNLDTLGYGAPHCITTGCTLSGPQYRYPRDLLRRCEAVADRLGLSDAVGSGPPTPTDGVAFLSRGIPGLTIMTFQKGFYVPNLHQMSDTAERMDIEITAQSTEFAWEVLQDLAN